MNVHSMFLLAAPEWPVLAAMLGLLVVGLVFLAVFARYFRLWIQAVSTNAEIGLIDLLRMTFRKVNPTIILRSKIMAGQAGVGGDGEITTKGLEAHYLAGGNVPLVIRAIIAAHKAKIVQLGFKQATAIDLAGRDVFEAVQMSVNPKVITTPKVAAMAKDGIQLLAVARVTVRANINRLVGGAGEETILARVGEGIVSTIGSSETHKRVLENPDAISQTVLAKGLDAGTAFEILSIDVADVDVGKNIGAELQTDQAEADKRIAQAKAEERRALAVAKEQEYIAEAQRQRAKVIEAEAEIPKAMADAFRSGNLGVMDYQKYRNIQADTSMRNTIAGKSDKQAGKE